MSDADARHEVTEQNADAAQDRLSGSGSTLPQGRRLARLPDVYPPEDYRSLAAEYPLLAVAAGAGFGLLLGAVVPKRLTAGLGKRALGAVSVAGQLGLALAAQTRDKAPPASTDAKARVPAPDLHKGPSPLALAREAIRLVGKLRK